MTDRFTRSGPAQRIAAVALVFGIALGAAGCTFDEGVSVSSRESTPPPPPSAGTTDQNSPFIVAASAIGKRSRDQVLALHELGLSTTHEEGVAHDQVSAQAEQLVAGLDGLVEESTMMTPPAGTPAALLVTSLEGFAQLAETLVSWDAAEGAIPAEWFEQLGELDAQWREALQDLSDLSGDDLLKDLPELVTAPA